MKTNFPFREGVPRPLGVLLLLLMFVPPTFSGGAYLSNAAEMTGALGVWAEEVQLAAFFTNIGMCLFPPFMVPFLQARRTKQTYLWCFSLLVVLNSLCAVTHSIPWLMVWCLLTGLVRSIAMINCTFTIAPYVTGMNTLAMFTMTEKPSPEEQYLQERKRTFLMPLLYGVILIIAQLSNVVVAWFAQHYTWRHAYWVVVGMLLVGILLVFLTMADEKRPFRYRPASGMVADMMLMAVALCLMTFFLAFAKTFDWCSSPFIVWAIGGFLISVGLLVWRGIEGRYLPLSVFGYRNVLIASVLFVVFMVFNTSSNFIGTFAKLSMPVSNYHVASLSLYALMGCVVGFVLSILMVLRRWHFRWIFAVGLLIMAASNGYMYFQYTTQGSLPNLQWAMMLHFVGLLILYALVAAFGMKHLPSRYLATFVFLMILFRNVVGPALGSGIYSNWMEHRQQAYVTELVQKMDSPAVNQPVAQLYGRVVRQSALLAMKDISGQTSLLLLSTACVVLLLPYHKNESS